MPHNHATWPCISMLQAWIHPKEHNWFRPRRQFIIRRDKGDTFPLHVCLCPPNSTSSTSSILSFLCRFSFIIPLVMHSPFPFLSRSLVMTVLVLHVTCLALAISCYQSWLPVAATDSSLAELSTELICLVPPSLVPPVPSAALLFLGPIYIITI